MDGFRTVKRAGIKVSGGDRVAVPALTLEPGGAEETVTVTSEAPLIQASSGERSFAVSTTEIENLPINHGNFTAFTSLTPGVTSFGASAGGTRLGGVSQNNIMMDGISAMDTGNNGQMLNMNIESIAEVKVLTQGYQAEYGRSSGLQITAVTKSGTNRFRGSAYDIKINSDWNENSWVNAKNGDPKSLDKRDIYGYAIGGPVGKPGGNNKLFFFYTHEYRPTNQQINNGNPIRFKVPTGLERAGDFSQSVDQNGAPIPALIDWTTGQAFPNNQIPANKLNQTSLALLSRYPTPTRTQTAGSNYNYEQLAPPAVENLTTAAGRPHRLPAVVEAAYHRQVLRPAGARARDARPHPGLLGRPVAVPLHHQLRIHSQLRAEPDDLHRRHLRLHPQRADRRQRERRARQRLVEHAGLDARLPDALRGRWCDSDELLWVRSARRRGSAVVGRYEANLPPNFGWGSRVQGNAGTCAAPSVPCQRYPGWLNINRTQDVAISVTKVAGRHTLKGGFYNNHSFKAQNVGAGGIANLTFQGYVNFGNDTNNALDTGYGYANAATGVFTQYLQASKFVEGSMIYNNTEFYVQDNWKVNNRLTLDYGLRFTHQQPQHDQYQQMSNFFPDQWSASQAPVFYVPGCSNGAATCAGNLRNAMDPRTGQILTAPGAANTQTAIGTPIPGTGNAVNGIKQAGDGISKYGYTWPALVFGPRFGAAYDLSGDQSFILRGGAGLFFDRPDGNTVFSIPGNPPIATAQDLRSGTLSTLGQGLSPQPVPAMVTFQYDAKVPASWQWQFGAQMSLPWASSLDISYVGNHGYDRMGGLQGGNTMNLNAVDIGAAFLTQNQDPTLAPSATPGANALPDNALRAYRGLAVIAQNTTGFWDTYHSIQTAFQRRFQNGFSFGANYTLGLSLNGNTGLVQRLQHAPDGTISYRSDQAEYEELNKQLVEYRRHVAKVNGVWDMPDLTTSGAGAAKKTVGYIVNDWRISGVLTANSGPRYDLNYGYNANGGNRNITGSPDYAARIIYTGDPGSGCSDNQYGQFNWSAVTAPTYSNNSLGLESGRGLLVGCADKTVDLSLARTIRLGGSRNLEFRFDAFNAFNVAIINARSTTITYDNPVSRVVQNPQYLADGTLNPARLTPRNAGFGAATGAQNMRNFQAMIRFQF